MSKAVRKKKVVFLMTGAKTVPGGIACLNRNILKALEKSQRSFSVNVEVLSYLESDGDRPVALDEKIEFRGFDGNKILFSVAAIQSSYRSDLVVVDHVSLAKPLLPLAATDRIELAIFAHGPEAWRNVRRLSILTYRSASRVWANSGFTLRKMRGRFSGFDGVVCEPGLNPNMVLNPSIPVAKNASLVLEAVDGNIRRISERAFLLVGRMSKKQNGKGHGTLVRALEQVKKIEPLVQLVFPGPGDARVDVAELARACGVADSVFLPGYVSDELLDELYRSSFAFTMPSRQDGFGLAYLEAMNYGKACVGCHDDGGECVIVDGVTGILVDPNAQVEGVVEALKELLVDPCRTENMGKAGFERLHERFTSDAFQSRFCAEMEKLL